MNGTTSSESASPLKKVERTGVAIWCAESVRPDVATRNFGVNMKKVASTGRLRGRPKTPWEPIEEELFRRLTRGEACPTLEAEAKYLAEFVRLKDIKAEGTNPSAPIAAARIRERIKKRYGGSAQGYKQAREHHLI